MSKFAVKIENESPNLQAIFLSTTHNGYAWTSVRVESANEAIKIARILLDAVVKGMWDEDSVLIEVGEADDGRQS